MKKTIMSLALTMSLAMAFANPLDLKQVPESAKFIVHFNMEKFKETELGKEVIGKALENRDVNGLNQVLELFGVDPINHVNDVTAYGDSFEKGRWLVILDGSISVLKVLDQVKQNGKYEKEISNGIETYVVTLHDKTIYFFSENNCVYFSEEKSMIDLHTSLISGKTKSADIAKSDIISSVNTDGIISVGVASGFPVKEKNNPMAEAFKKVDSIGVSIKEESSYVHVNLALRSQDDESAKLLHSTVMGFLSLGKMQGDKMALVKESMDSLEDNLNGSSISFKTKISVKNLIQIIETKKMHHQEAK